MNFSDEVILEATIENGFAKVAAGDWLMGQAQPAASLGVTVVKGLRGLFVPDRTLVRAVSSEGEAWCAAADAPFITRLDALPDQSLKLVSAKLLVAPRTARVGAKSVKLVPFSFNRAMPVTEFRLGWAVAATRSRVMRRVLEEGETMNVRPEAVVAWIGPEPTGFCPRLSFWDILLPRPPTRLSFTFHGPSVVWFEGSSRPVERRRGNRRVA